MKYTVQSTKYIARNFFYLLPFAVLPALLFTLSMDVESMQCVIDTLFQGKISELHFHHLFRAVSVLNFGSPQSVVFGLLAIVGIIVCVALMLALIEKHFRIGKRTFNGVFSRLNDNFISTCGYGFILLAVYEIWCLLTTALLYAVVRISVLPLAYGLGILAFLTMHVLLIYGVSAIYLWLPCMQITGFKAVEALKYSYQLVRPVKYGILVGQLVCLLVAEAIICASAYFVGNYLTFIVVTTLIFAIVLMVYCVRMELAYFDRDHLGRADIKGIKGF